MTQTREDEGLELLGNQQVSYPTDYAPEMLETFQNKHPENDYWVKFNCPEFTSLCPITGQPDFATIYINYVPDERMVESKSLKLYLFSFRNHGDFHEDCVNTIMKDLIALRQLRSPEHALGRGCLDPPLHARIKVSNDRVVCHPYELEKRFITTMLWQAALFLSVSLLLLF